jgi:hypothetical protein
MVVSDVATVTGESSPSQAVPPPSVPGVWRAAIGVLAVGTLVSCLGMIVVGSVLTDTPSWDVLAFEAIVLAAAVIAGLCAAGRFRDGPGLALVSVGGTVLGASVLAYLGSGRVLYLSGQETPTSLNAYVMGRVALGLLFGVVAAGVVLTRSRAAMVTGLKAILLWVPVVGGLAAVWKRHAVAAALDTMPSFVAPLAFILGGLVFVAFLCAAVHTTIQAFERGRFKDEIDGVDAAASA